jgi:AcrR family transcriptional regulator
MISEKKQAIFEGTLELVKDHGFHNCPMSVIAKTAGVAAGTIYHYFESKDQLILELYEYVTNNMAQAMFAGDDKRAAYKERFYNLWMNLFRFYVEHPNAIKFFQQFVHSPYYTENYNEKDKHDCYMEQLFAFFREGVEKAYLRKVNPEILGVLTHGNISTTARMQSLGRIPLGEKELEQIFQILWDGMVAE